MNGAKNYFTVVELQQICEALGLLSDGLKAELVERISNFVSQPMDVSRVSVFRVRTPSIETSEQAIQVSSETPIAKDEPRSKSWKHIFSWCVGVVGVLGGFLTLFQTLFSDETIEIPVKRSWF